MKKYIVIITMLFLTVSISAQNCKPAYQNKDDFTNESVKAFGGKVVPTNTLNLLGNSIGMDLYIEENNNGLKAVALWKCIFNTKEDYELAKDQYLNRDLKFEFYIKLENDKVLSFSTTKTKFDNFKFDNLYTISIVGGDEISKEDVEELKTQKIVKVRYVIGGKSFEDEVKSKNAEAIQEKFSCVTTDKIEDSEIDEAAMQKLVGTWTKNEDKTIKIIFYPDGTYKMSQRKTSIEGTYKVARNKLITTAVIYKKETSDSEDIVELTDEKLSIQGKKSVVSYTKVSNETKEN